MPEWGRGAAGRPAAAARPPAVPGGPVARTIAHAPASLWVIALASAAIMVYEIAITRILSVVLWYHFAFLAVSLAMLGLGAPGIWYALRPPGPRALERSLIAAAVTIPASLALLLQYGGPLAMRAGLATACILAPMLALGSAVCILLIRSPGPAIARTYAADLAGATAGAIAVVPLMHVVATPTIVAGTSLLATAALAVSGRRAWAAGLTAVIVALLAWNAPFQVRYTKNYSERDFRPTYEQWTPTARLTVFPTVFWVDDPKAAFGWGMGTRYVPRPLEQLWLEQDGSAGTPIARLAGSPRTHDYLFYDVTSLAYQLRPADRACVIGAGGGRDLLTALAAGTRHVDAVELNPHIVDLVSRRFGAFSGDVYHLPGVNAVVSEGRSFLTRAAGGYDVIQISLIDSWAATVAGAYALSENYLYTIEAYRLYWRRLGPAGMISTTRWIAGDRMLEALRLGHLVREALRREGVEHPEQHVAVVQAGRVATVIASREPFSGRLLERLRAVCEARGFERHWPPAPGAEHQGIAAYLERGADALAAQGIDLTAPTDDRPFFFHTVPVFGHVSAATLAVLSANERATVLLQHLMLIVTVLAAVLFFVPFVLRRWRPGGAGFRRGSAYFGLIGLGFMLVELPVIQKSILYLGHPSHATTVVLASMLLGAGVGAWASARLPGRAVVGWGVALIAMLVAGLAVVSAGFPATIGLPWAARAAVAGGTVGAMGAVMGVALPAGMMRFGEAARPWFWAVNGFCGVAASVCSLGLGMTFGFAAVVGMGIGCYAAAIAVIAAAPRPMS